MTINFKHKIALVAIILICFVFTGSLYAAEAGASYVDMEKIVDAYLETSKQIKANLNGIFPDQKEIEKMNQLQSGSDKPIDPKLIEKFNKEEASRMQKINSLIDEVENNIAKALAKTAKENNAEIIYNITEYVDVESKLMFKFMETNKGMQDSMAKSQQGFPGMMPMGNPNRQGRIWSRPIVFGRDLTGQVIANFNH